MWIDYYSAAAFDDRYDLKKMLSQDEIESLRQVCSCLGVEGWRKWLRDNLPEVMDYVRSVPSRRKKIKAWQSPDIKGLLVLSAIVVVSRSCFWLDALRKLPFEPGESYRDMTAAIGEIASEFAELPSLFWPFPDPNPFLKE